jgi:hypothetical protein
MRHLARSFRRGAAVAAAPGWDRPLAPLVEPGNPLQAYFDTRHEGPGIWKWRHYFEIYDRHLGTFRGKAPIIAEIGIYSGGSLPMWMDYFGPGTQVHGIDIEPACNVHAGPGIHVHIGDQSDRAFWAGFRKVAPKVDILIDDGGHEPEQQSVSLEEMLAHIAPGGVYICEDVHGAHNPFTRMVAGLASEMNAMEGFVAAPDDPERRLSVALRGAARRIKSVAFYPFMIVIELNDGERGELVAPKHGTIWEPHLS